MQLEIHRVNCFLLLLGLVFRWVFYPSLSTKRGVRSNLQFKGGKTFQKKGKVHQRDLC